MDKRIDIKDDFKARIPSMDWIKDLVIHEVKACSVIKIICEKIK